MKTYYSYYKAPIGQLLLAGDGEALSLLGFPRGKMRREHEAEWIRDLGPFAQVNAELDRYFAGELTQFTVPLAPSGTAFQERVWSALQEIPYGVTWSYGDLARHIGKPSASRAVGAANGLNPIPVIIPCHRVIGSNGKLTGFGGGLDVKEYLLGLESQRMTPGLNFG